MTRRELFGMVLVSAAASESQEPTVKPAPGQQLIDTKTKKQIGEWGQVIDTLTADMPLGVEGELRAGFKRTHATPARYEVTWLRVTAEGLRRY